MRLAISPDLIRTSGIAAAFAVIAQNAIAQSTGSVASPVVRPGASISLASGLAIDDGEQGYATRIDYRHTLSDRWRVGAMVFLNDRSGDYRYRRLGAEVMYQFASSDVGWNSAVQVRGRLPDRSDGPGRVRVAWLNRWRPATGPEIRLIGLASQEVGEDAKDGLALETRSEATWKITSDTRIGAQVFNRYNTTDALGSFKTQRHSVGGIVKGSLTDRLSYRVNVLTGVSDEAADFEVRFRIRLAV